MIQADIFVPTSKDVQTLSSCLNHLNVQTFRSFRIILVGIVKDERVQKLIKKYPQLKIVYFIQNKPGLTNAAIEALKKSTHELFIRIDDDVEVTPYWLENIVNTFAGDKKIGGVTGPTLLTRKGLQSRDSISFLKNIDKNYYLIRYLIKSYLYENKIFAIGKFLRSGNFTIGANFKSSLEYKKSLSVDNFEACNFACRTKLIKRLGGFDPLFSRGLGEYHEADAARNIIETGFKIKFNPKVVVWHKVENGVTDKTRPDARFRIFNFIVFYRKHFKQTTIDAKTRFLANVIMQNMYYIYKYFKSGDSKQLSCVIGTLEALTFKL